MAGAVDANTDIECLLEQGFRFGKVAIGHVQFRQGHARWNRFDGVGTVAVYRPSDRRLRVGQLRPGILFGVDRDPRNRHHPQKNGQED